MEENTNSHNDNIQTDAADAFGFSFGSSNKPKHILKSVVGKNDYFYNMAHKKRGLAIIFNHQTFIVPYLKDRMGTNVDCEQLKMCLKKLDFEVHVYNDLGVKDILDKVEKVSSEDHSDHDCIVLAILTHGEEGLLFARDGAYKHDQVFDNFRGDRCPTLVGKPKIFFIQACQGSRLDGGIGVYTEMDSSVSCYKIPIYADFLVVYSTIPGFYSWRNTTNGSWFIQALTAELKESGTLYDLLTILTFVSRRVALDFESRVPDNSTMDKQKQIPCVTSMLTRLIKFSPKTDNINNSVEDIEQTVMTNEVNKN